MSPTAEQSLRERISTQEMGYSEVWRTVTDTGRDLAKALAEGNLDECERNARYIADISAWLRRGGGR